MNRYRPAPLVGEDGKPNGLYHYVKYNADGMPRSIGLCSGGCPGHSTPEEAAEHFRKWQTNNARYNLPAHTPGRCAVCDAETDQMAKAPPTPRLVRLCPEHNNPAGLKEALPLPLDLRALA